MKRPQGRTDFIYQNIRQFPHCDPMVLHSPGICTYCDKHKDWQALRMAWGIAFTDEPVTEDKMPCPATMLRPLQTINMWGGNQAQEKNGKH